MGGRHEDAPGEGLKLGRVEAMICVVTASCVASLLGGGT